MFILRHDQWNVVENTHTVSESKFSSSSEAEWSIYDYIDYFEEGDAWKYCKRVTNALGGVIIYSSNGQLKTIDHFIIQEEKES